MKYNTVLSLPIILILFRIVLLLVGVLARSSRVKRLSGLSDVRNRAPSCSCPSTRESTKRSFDLFIFFTT